MALHFIWWATDLSTYLSGKVRERAYYMSMFRMLDDTDAASTSDPKRSSLIGWFGIHRILAHTFWYSTNSFLVSVVLGSLEYLDGLAAYGRIVGASFSHTICRQMWLEPFTQIPLLRGVTDLLALDVSQFHDSAYNGASDSPTHSSRTSMHTSTFAVCSASTSVSVVRRTSCLLLKVI